jgi:ADP-heptose:LPS heptosyltransferase
LQPTSSFKPARSLLAIDMSTFGSSLALLPAMRALRASYPRSVIVAATSSGTCELLKLAGFVDDTIDLGVIKSSDRRYTSALRKLASLIRRSRRYDFDLVLDFSPRLETQIASRLILRARTITPSRLPRAMEAVLDLVGVTGSFDRSGPSNHKRVLEQVGAEMTDTTFRVTLPYEEHARFEQRLVKAGSRGGELLVLFYASNPNDSRGWPVKAFAETATRLANNLGARIIAADEPCDSAFTDALRAFPVAGITTDITKLAEPRAVELLAAIARASIAITDEPAIAQLASELGTPVIEIAESASRNFVKSKSHRSMEASSRKRITIDEVYETACELIQESRSPSLFQRP